MYSIPKYGAPRGTWTPTVSRQNLNLVRLPIPPEAHIYLVTLSGIEPELPPWKGGVLTAWP